MLLIEPFLFHARIAIRNPEDYLMHKFLIFSCVVTFITVACMIFDVPKNLAQSNYTDMQKCIDNKTNSKFGFFSTADQIEKSCQDDIALKEDFSKLRTKYDLPN